MQLPGLDSVLPQFGFEQVRTAFILPNLSKKTRIKTEPYVRLNVWALPSLPMSVIPTFSCFLVWVLIPLKKCNSCACWNRECMRISGLWGYCCSNIIAIIMHYLLFSCLIHAHSHHRHSLMKTLRSFLMFRRSLFNSIRIDHSASCVWCGCVLALRKEPR